MSSIPSRIAVRCIETYQRFISPYKGFNCAHHSIYGEETCSTAIKSLVSEHGLVAAWPKIVARFDACRDAANLAQLQLKLPKSDLGCDIGCDPGIADCGSGSSNKTTVCIAPCDLLANLGSSSRKTQRRVFVVALIAVCLSSYWFYGRNVSAIVLSPLSSKQTLIEKLTQRQEPQLRVMLVVDGRKYYSETRALVDDSAEITLPFLDGPSSYKIDSLEVHDARFKLGTKLLVVGQVLDQHSAPLASGEGENYRFELKRRWHFWQ